jgi:hypothetical protein
MSASGRTLVLSGALLTATGAAAVAAPCTTALLSVYDATGFSCSVGDKTFSAFSYNPSNLGVPTDADITVMPDGGPTDPGLLFSDDWSNPTTVGQDATLFFTVTETGTGTIIGATLQVSGGVGSFSDEETDVPLSQLDLVATDNTLHSTSFNPPLTTIRVSDDILLNPGAHITSIDKRFDQPPPQTPEPGTLSILGTALLLLLVAWEWRRRA